MDASQEQLYELLVLPGHVSEEDFGSSVSLAKRTGAELADVLVEKDFIQDRQLGRLFAESLGVPYVSERSGKIGSDLLDFVPEVVARSKELIPFEKTEQDISVAMVDPRDLDIIHAIEKRTGLAVIPHLITRRDLRASLIHYEQSVKSAFDELVRKLSNPALPSDDRDEAMVEMVDTMLAYGYENRASDIHMEPYRAKVVVRFRIDGVMHDVLDIPQELQEVLVTRVKVLSKLRTDEHRSAQDGKLRFEVATGSGETTGTEKEIVDVRVSIVPVQYGENVVMRLLSSKTRQFSLESIGLSSGDTEKVRRAIAHPHGMMLVTGPTGSGKTTTIYSMMKILNRREVHISTIEDPVEYDIEGVSQIQVNTKTKLTFAAGLRSIVRQDPDIIMVGEIRDHETADIAVNSAMTGHLVLSTLHANDAATTLPRLLDMGIEPFLVASTVNVIIAQRLVRKICETCRASASLSDEQIAVMSAEAGIVATFAKLGHQDLTKVMLFKGGGCSRCSNTGYAGRIGLFEVLEMSERIRKLVVERASADQIIAVAREEGMGTMMEDGIAKVTQGQTTIEEVLRVTKA
jgi:type IV pilus assembly protein PilB